MDKTPIASNLYEEFAKQFANDSWQLFLESKKKEWTEKLNNMSMILPNAKDGIPYHAMIEIKSDWLQISSAIVEGTNSLQCLIDNDVQNKTTKITVEGTPNTSNNYSQFNVVITAQCSDCPQILLTRKIPLVVNPDPKDLWKDIPVPENIEYPKVDEECDYATPSGFVDNIDAPNN
jgi:hypothetical protein